MLTVKYISPEVSEPVKKRVKKPSHRTREFIDQMKIHVLLKHIEKQANQK